jgi:hypothetical protein
VLHVFRSIVYVTSSSYAVLFTRNPTLYMEVYCLSDERATSALLSLFYPEWLMPTNLTQYSELYSHTWSTGAVTITAGCRKQYQKMNSWQKRTVILYQHKTDWVSSWGNTSKQNSIVVPCPCPNHTGEESLYFTGLIPHSHQLLFQQCTSSFTLSIVLFLVTTNRRAVAATAEHSGSLSFTECWIIEDLVLHLGCTGHFDFPIWLSSYSTYNMSTPWFKSCFKSQWASRDLQWKVWKTEPREVNLWMNLTMAILGCSIFLCGPRILQCCINVYFIAVHNAMHCQEVTDCVLAICLKRFLSTTLVHHPVVFYEYTILDW